MSVSTTEGEEVFRPHRLLWKDASSFVLQGLGTDSKSKRVYLRLANSGEAGEAATIIKNRVAAIEVPLARIEELQVLVSFLLSRRGIVLQLYLFLVRFAVAGITLTIGFSLGAVGEVASTGFVLFYLGVPLWALRRRRGRKALGWLGFAQGSLSVRTATQVRSITPIAMEWREPETFLLKGRGSKLELSFSTREKAIQVAEKIRSAFPTIQVIPVRWEDAARPQ